MTAKREIQKREDMEWVIYTELLSSMLAIENNRENNPILNQIKDILAELHNQGKQITLYKLPVHIGIKRNKEADKAAKQAKARDDHDRTTSHLTIKRARN